MQRSSATILSIGLALGLALGAGVLGTLLGRAALDYRALERNVVVKGLAEREVPADTVIWPLTFSVAANEVSALYAMLEENAATVRAHLKRQGVPDGVISVSSPVIVDKLEQSYAEAPVTFRYGGRQSVTVYSNEVERIRKVMGTVSELGRQGVVLVQDYESTTQFLFDGLNGLKPAMIEEATRNAREVGERFAADSGSGLGRIRTADQGQFVISDRDSQTPWIKRVRVVSTVQYYLVD